VTPSPTPNSWRLRDIFLVGIVYGLYLTLSTWVLYHVSEQGWGVRELAAAEDPAIDGVEEVDVLHVRLILSYLLS
jgi:hypothetical protein